MSRRVEFGIGLVAGVAGIVGLGFLVFGPAWYTYGTTWVAAGLMTLWDQGLDATMLLFIAAMVVASLGIAAAAYMRVQGFLGAAAVAWASTIVLAAGAFLTLPGDSAAFVPLQLHTGIADSVGVGIYLIPSLVLSIIASMGATFAHYEPRGGLRPHPR